MYIASPLDLLPAVIGLLAAIFVVLLIILFTQLYVRLENVRAVRICLNQNERIQCHLESIADSNSRMSTDTTTMLRVQKNKEDMRTSLFR